MKGRFDFETIIAAMKNLWLFSLLTLLGLSACGPQPDFTIRLTEDLAQEAVWVPIDSQSGAWRIGFDSRLEPKDDVRQAASLAMWLQNQTGLSFQIYLPATDGNIVDDLCAGRVDFAIVGTVSYLQASDQCGAHILVRGRNLDGQATYRAAIVVAPDSPLQSLNDVRGHTFAFGAVNSTQGNLIPRMMFQQAGLTLEDFKAYTYTGSHVATANAVTSGRYDAGALQDTLALNLAQRGLVRILALSEPFPSSGIVGGPDVPQTTIELVRQALLQLDPVRDAASLYQWDRTEMPLGFVAAQDSEYDQLRQIAHSIGILEP